MPKGIPKVMFFSSKGRPGRQGSDWFYSFRSHRKRSVFGTFSDPAPGRFWAPNRTFRDPGRRPKIALELKKRVPGHQGPCCRSRAGRSSVFRLHFEWLLEAFWMPSGVQFSKKLMLLWRPKTTFHIGKQTLSWVPQGYFFSTKGPPGASWII